MSKMRIIMIVFVIALAGCDCNIFQFASDLLPFGGSNSQNVGDVSPDDIGDPNAPALHSPAILEGAIQLRITNGEEVGAACRVAMEIAGREVHFSFRNIPAGSRAIVIGPERTDLLKVDATFKGASPIVAEQQVLRIGEDFVGGEIVDVTLRIPEESVIEPEPNEPNIVEPPAELAIAIRGLDLDAKVNPGTVIGFDVVASNFSNAGRVSAYADPDSNPANGNELPIVADVTALSSRTVSWDTSNVPAGFYTIFAVLDDGDRSITSSPAAGHIAVNALPFMNIISPVSGDIANVSEFLVIEWSGEDADDDARVNFFLDQDEDPDNGNEIAVASDVSENDQLTRILPSSIFGLPRGEMFLGGTIDDGLSRQVVYSGPICITSGRNGMYLAADLAQSEATSLEGAGYDPNSSSAFGYSIDSSADLDGDGVADMLIGDPNGLPLDGPAYGGVYFRRGVAGGWPRQLDGTDATSYVSGQESGSGLGTSVAFVSALEPNSPYPFDAVFGAPLEDNETDDNGTAWFFHGDAVLNASGGRFFLNDGNPMSSYYTDEHAGQCVARLGDFDGDGRNDAAIGAPGWMDDSERTVGRAVIIYGGYGLPCCDLDSVGYGGEVIPGLQIFGASNGDRTGAAIADVGNFSEGRGVSIGADVLVGAPGAAAQAGVVYMVFGESVATSGQIEIADPNQWDGITFVGETDGEAGTAVASLDFNGDGRRDILIGAPSYASGRGRAYLILNLASNPLPSVVSLEDVGGASVPGAKIDGFASGDGLGFSLANAGDIDDDGFEDFVVGAPFHGEGYGYAAVIYGGQDLSGIVSVSDIGTCLLHGYLIEGDQAGELMGFAVSGGGDLDGNGLPDVSIGAPGFELTSDELTVGRANVIFNKPVLPPGAP